MAIPQAYGPAGFQAAFGATDAQVADLVRFEALLFDWNQRMNLVGPSAQAEFWSRHVLDSAQLLRVAPEALTFADLGAGAGFPGIVLACLLKGREGAQVHLIESMAKRCRFLSEVVRELALPATVHNARAEDVTLKVDVVTARAVAPLVRLLDYARPYLKRGAVGLFLKGQDVEVELAEASKSWKFESHLTPSLSHTLGRIVEIKKVSRA
ncbi:16S rRNA (guanine(527)-N(7))-methyltransferase RsmG [Phenylobacterium montanum]|uniref:Ribosomal RNA small subunit methyltransferase G n=1 Tax=Phenylobacterium montanum TaxID=2823693 RepID=A0A975FWP2_9CAUL|nr:16S rRNA (guanine(527)-N(7))-methyltransferase RsmG [Caulobacter sp. S6]QUD86644.1 16S rRNA (guanine(527)-N(7))-methyltransferase RsmG [Caulobacter sp. S6]